MAVGHSDDVDPLDAISAAIAQCEAALGELKPQAFELEPRGSVELKGKGSPPTWFLLGRRP